VIELGPVATTAAAAVAPAAGPATPNSPWKIAAKPVAAAGAATTAPYTALSNPDSNSSKQQAAAPSSKDAAAAAGDAAGGKGVLAKTSVGAALQRTSVYGLAGAAPVGIITLEDVLEELMQVGVVVLWCVVVCCGVVCCYLVEACRRLTSSAGCPQCLVLHGADACGLRVCSQCSVLLAYGCWFDVRLALVLRLLASSHWRTCWKSSCRWVWSCGCLWFVVLSYVVLWCGVLLLNCAAGRLQLQGVLSAWCCLELMHVGQGCARRVCVAVI
jgi:hypothetical protein